MNGKQCSGWQTRSSRRSCLRTRSGRKRSTFKHPSPCLVYKTESTTEMRNGKVRTVCSASPAHGCVLELPVEALKKRIRKQTNKSFYFILYFFILLFREDVLERDRAERPADGRDHHRQVLSGQQGKTACHLVGRRIHFLHKKHATPSSRSLLLISLFSFVPCSDARRVHASMMSLETNSSQNTSTKALFSMAASLTKHTQ